MFIMFLALNIVICTTKYSSKLLYIYVISNSGENDAW